MKMINLVNLKLKRFTFLFFDMAYKIRAPAPVIKQSVKKAPKIISTIIIGYTIDVKVLSNIVETRITNNQVTQNKAKQIESDIILIEY